MLGESQASRVPALAPDFQPHPLCHFKAPSSLSVSLLVCGRKELDPENLEPREVYDSVSPSGQDTSTWTAPLGPDRMAFPVNADLGGARDVEGRHWAARGVGG